MPNAALNILHEFFDFDTIASSPIASEIRVATLSALFSNYFLQTYFSLVLYLILTLLICSLLATLAYLFSLSSIQDSEKKSEYECGFEPFDSATRLPFDVHFYLVGILFLIFDVEIALLFPWVLGIKAVGWFGFYLRRSFIFILSIGFLYEWKRGALIWPSRQQERVYAKKQSADPLFCLVVAISIAAPLVYRFAIPSSWKFDHQLVATNDVSLILLTPQATIYCLKNKTAILRTKGSSSSKNSNTGGNGPVVRGPRGPETFWEKICRLAKQHSRACFFVALIFCIFLFIYLLSTEQKCELALGLLYFVAYVVTLVVANFDDLRTLGYIIVLLVALYFLWTHDDKGGGGNSSIFGLFAATNEQTKFAWEQISLEKRLPYSEQITTYLTVEVTLRALLRYVLTALALELGEERSKTVLARYSLNGLCLGLAIVSLAAAIRHLSKVSYSLFNGYLLTSPYVTARKLLALVACSFVLRSSRQYVTKHARHLLEYAVIFTLTVLFIGLLVRSSNRRSAFRAVVGFSLNLYVLILFDAPKGGAREAGVKYYFLSTFSSGLRIYGIFIFFATASSLNFFERAQILTSDSSLRISALFSLRVGIALLLNGIFFKLSAFPGHLWAAEVYEGSPDPIVAFFRLPIKIAVLSFLLSILAVALTPLSFAWQPFLRVSTFGSLVWGCLGALGEKNTKRFLAYASINQIGFLILGLTASSSEGSRATILYLLIYSLRNLGFLSVFLSARRRAKGGRLFLTDFRSLGQQNWLVSWSAARMLFSRAGIPPLAGFFGKYLLLLHSQQETLYILVVAALSVSLISTYYYLRIIKTRWFEGQEQRVSIVCNISSTQQSVRFLVEAILWTFIVFSGTVVALAEKLEQVLIAPNAYA